MKKAFLLILLFVSITAYSQDKKAKKYFDKACKAYNKKDYKTADSLFLLSAKLYPDKATYLNLALTKEKLGEHCISCYYLITALKYGDNNALELYKKNCQKNDTTIYQKVKEKNVSYFYIKSEEQCTKKKSFTICKKFVGNSFVYSFVILSNDSFSYKENDFLTPDFEIEKVPQENIAYILSDKMPSFPDGENARLNFIIDNIRYPLDAKEANIQGTVYVTFIVEADGSITNIDLLRGIGGGCDEEAIKVVKMMPNWIPGKVDGKNVRFKFNMPIKFTLNH